jgi:signal transduction histidine kinase
MPPDTTPPGTRTAAGYATIDGVYDQMKVIETARQALLGRKRFSVQQQIYITYALVFLLVLGVAFVLIMSINRTRSRLEFLEFVNEFSAEIQQARRFEKNFFLYGTNLDDALVNVHLARAIYTGNADQFASILGPEQQRGLLLKLDGYLNLLEELQTLQKRDPGRLSDSVFLGQIENELRQYGKDMVTSAQALMHKEKTALAATLNRSRDIHIVSLVVLLLMLGASAYWLVGRIFASLRRFSGYAQRIADGDFRPITPSQRYRDEFTELAIAVNEMIKEIAKREATLIQTHKMRAVGTLTAGVAHELNNPINNIMLTVHMLLEDYPSLSDEERLEMLRDAAGETGRARDIIANLLDFARESSSVIETLDVARILRETIRLAENQVRLADIKIDLQVTPCLPTIHGDGQKLQQVFLNLILNAVDASPKGGRIRVMALPADQPDRLAVKVIDYGHGIPPHVLPSIFDPFFTTKDKGKGTGLGLSVSQGIVAKHGGRIQVHSEVGSGSTFTVLLPVNTLAQCAPQA